MPALVAVAGALVVAAPWLWTRLERREIDTLRERLTTEATLVGEAVPWAEGAPLQDTCTRLSRDLGLRVTVIATAGLVLCDSARSGTGARIEEQSEVREALAAGRGYAVRADGPAGERVMYAAIRQAHDGATRIVRAAVPLTSVAETVAQMRWLLLCGLLLGLLVAAAVALLLARRLMRRLQRLVGFAEKLAVGESPPYIAPEQPDDVGKLEAQLGEMARRIGGTIGELRVERERLEAILRGMVEGVLVTDLSGGVVLLNARARELLALPPDASPRGRPLVELSRDPALGDLMRELAAGAGIASRDVTLSAGTGPTLQVNAARLRGADGEAFGFVLVLHDVTELRRLEVIRRDFVANVSHELRTPLTAIKGYAETLLGSAGDDRETARRFLAVIDRHSERLGRLINDLLTLSDLELGRTPMRLNAVPVAAAVDDVLQIFADPVARAGVMVDSDVAPGLPPVHADGDRLRQVLINLVDNAAKYAPPRTRIAVTAGRQDAGAPVEYVRVSVSDEGPGIPPEDRPFVFEAFRRGSGAYSVKAKGSGLGLAVCKGLIRAHSGSIWIAESAGPGTTICFTLPVSA